jgi:hypothetical protein
LLAAAVVVEMAAVAVVMARRRRCWWWSGRRGEGEEEVENWHTRGLAFLRIIVQHTLVRAHGSA